MTDYSHQAQEGLEAALTGQPATPPYPKGTEAAAAWLRNYRFGKRVLARDAETKAGA